MVNSAILGIALAMAAMLAANAQETTTIVKEKPAVVVPPPAVAVPARPGVVIEKREPVTTGRGCSSKTVRREGVDESKTVTRERCD